MIYALVIIGVLLLGMVLSSLSTKFLVDYYEKVKKINASCNTTAFELLVFFIVTLNLDIKVTRYSNYLDNSYNVNKKLIILSNDVFDNKSVGALAVSMHELGHAVQHKNKSFLFKLYVFISFLNKITSFLLLPLIIFLIVSMFLEIQYFHLALILIFVFYLINLLARIIIIPLEKNASKLAINLLKEYNIFDVNELKMANRLLNLACFTYIGGFFNIYIEFIRKVLKGF